MGEEGNKKIVKLYSGSYVPFPGTFTQHICFSRRHMGLIWPTETGSFLITDRKMYFHASSA